MRSLLWKDLRMNALPLVVGGVLVIAPHAVAILNLLREYYPARPPATAWGTDLFAGGVYGLWFSVFTLALLGGNAVARERVDGSAWFLAMLPVSRAQILASKAALIVVAWAVVWLAHFAVMYGAAALFGVDPASVEGVRAVAAMPFGACLVAVGTSWGASASWESPAIAVAFGLASVIVVAFLAQGLVSALGWTDARLGTVILAGWLVVGVGAAAAGTGSYLRRIGL